MPSLGGQWINTVRIRDEAASLFSGIVFGIDASGMVYWILAKANPWYQWSKFDDFDWITCFDVRFRWANLNLRCILNLVKPLLGLLNLLNETPNIFSQVAYPLIAGVGLGMLFHAPYQVFTRALKPQELATGTSAFFLVRFTGATVGLVSLSIMLIVLFAKAMVKAVAGTIYYARASRHLPDDLRFQGSSSSIDYSAIKSLPPDVKELVLHTISSSIRVSSFTSLNRGPIWRTS